jgi:hypothetical protein
LHQRFNFQVDRVRGDRKCVSPDNVFLPDSKSLHYIVLDSFQLFSKLA